MKKLPNFICVGAQKAGTTTLHNILIQHPDIFLPKEKETKFFLRDSDYEKGIQYYCSQYFSNATSERCIGEVDPEYLYFKSVPSRIYKALKGEIKLIFLLRNPIDRAYSHYLMSRRRGYETCSFKEAIEKEPTRVKDVSNDTKYYSSKNHFSYIGRGLYAKQIRRYLNHFKIENMHFILFEEDLIANRECMTMELLNFLGVDANKTLETNLKSNPATLPKSTTLTKFLHKENLIKDILKKIIPNSRIRKSIKKAIDELNQKKIQKHKLDLSFRNHIFDSLFKKDVAMLEKMIERDLDCWRP